MRYLILPGKVSGNSTCLYQKTSRIVMPSPTDTKQWANTVLNALTCQPSQVYSVEYAASVRAVIQVTAQVLLLA